MAGSVHSVTTRQAVTLARHNREPSELADPIRHSLLVTVSSGRKLRLDIRVEYK